jgi:hypothetical protein
MDEITVIHASHEDWAGLVRRAAQPDGHEARVVLELHQRLLVVEERLPWVGTAADVAPQVEAATTADDLSPVEPAPQAPQGVTVEELACILSEAPIGDLGGAYWLLKHRRIGPLLRGEGYPAPKRVLLPEEPNNGPALYELNRTRDRGCFLAGWRSARAEAFRVGGQAIHAPAPKPVVLPEEVPDIPWLFEHDFRYMQGRRDAWAAARAEVARQQGGQADG